MAELILAVAFTLGVSAICSLLEAFILSTTIAEVEGLKKQHPHIGKRLEQFKIDINETSSAILTMNTIANTAGAMIVGVLAERVFDNFWLGILSGFMVLGILIFSEIIPKSIGVAYRKPLQVYLVYPLWLVRLTMKPFSSFAKKMLRVIVTHVEPTEEEQEEEIRLLAERSAQSGALSNGERDLISNALSLDDVNVESMMTPRTVVTFIKDTLTVEEVSREFRNIPFARLPIYGENIDNIVGVVRRRDILEASNEGRGEATMNELKGDVLFIPETASGLQALQQFIEKHHQLAVVVDEYGSTAGVVTMEDIVEHLIGEEIYEESDIAVDMRELAKKRAERMPSATPDIVDEGNGAKD
ncbi:MAG: CNNM domain-containing protein [Opitutales bacterium]|jgi:CBS domain containing-hemolysin-like protein